MRIKFWGTRGSLAKPGRATERYGGNTSCVEIRSQSGVLIVIDCGTGSHALGQALVAENKGAVNGHMLISHTHWDHIQGAPFFAPFFIPGGNWELYGPGGLSQSLRSTLAGQMEHTYFPITLETLAANIAYHDLVEGDFSIKDVNITTRYLNHPAMTLGYRLEVDGVSVAYCCDHEPHSPEMATGELALTGMDRRYTEFVAGADLVIHDCQFTAQEYPARIGWGHSPIEYAVRVCMEAGVKRLAITHHDPLRADDQIDQILENSRQRLRDCGSRLELMGAAEGLVLDLNAGEGSPSATARRNFGAQTAINACLVTRPVLLCAADSGVTTLLREALEAEGIEYRNLCSPEELQRGIKGDSPSLVIVEHNPPLVDGLDIARSIRSSEESDAIPVPIVLVTSAPIPESQEKVLDSDWLFLPFSLSYARARLRSFVLRSACRWINAPLPVDEELRLKALRKLALLDTPSEERFDRLTRIAAAALDVPVALVSLMDADRQWFKSCVGVEIRETPRDVAFCAHAVREKSELVVQDTFLDDRFADNPVVVDGPRIRAYTGMPLILDDGSCIGTFCVLDTRPREFNDAEMAIIRDLCDLAIAEIKQTPILSGSSGDDPTLPD